MDGARGRHFNLDEVECVGGGGGGYPDGGASNGGGGGAYARRSAMAVTPGNIYSYTIGAGGSGSAVTNGGATHFLQETAAFNVSLPRAKLKLVAGGTTSREAPEMSYLPGALVFRRAELMEAAAVDLVDLRATVTPETDLPGRLAVTGGGPGGNGGATANANGNSPC